MRTALLLFCSTVFSFTPINVISQNAKIVIDEDKTVTVDQIFDILQAQTNYTFIYRSDMFKDFPAVHLKKSIIKANDLLSYAISSDDYSFELLKDNTIVIEKKSDVSKAIQEKITGQVTDEAGIPLPGVTIAVKGTNTGVITDFDGSYSITVPNTKAILVFTSLGYQTQEIMVENKTVINVLMKESLNELDEIIVTGYQTISRERSTGSYSTVNSKKIESKVQTNILARLEGAIAGFSLYKGTPVIRGRSTLVADEAPLVVVDDVVYEGDLESINPSEIENVTVLKDATAASIYGARSANGVIVITTKGGVIGKPEFSYSSTLQITPLPNRSYANLMSSSEFIDYQMYIFDNTNNSPGQNSRLALNEVNRLLYDREDGNITEDFFNSEISRLRGLDGYEQVEDELLNSKITQQHNLSLKGGSEKHQYALSLNFLSTGSYEKDRSVERVGINMKNNFKLANWFDLDLGIIGSYNSYDNNIGISGITLLGSSRLPYQVLRDENGNPAQWEYIKSLTEVDRLNSLGLIDESYYPLNELDTRTQTYTNPYVNINIGAKFDLTESLNLQLRGQTEIGSSSLKDYSSIENYLVRKMINDASQIENNVISYNVPYGGQVTEQYSNQKSYTLRAQLNYTKLFGQKHDVNVLVGAEKRKATNTSGGYKRYGYDDTNLSFSPIDEATLSSSLIYGTNAYNGRYRFTGTQPVYVATDDRYVSFYANGAYTFDNKLGFNASIRMDQSNLFGTDPKYQYRPIWSVGANYNVNTEAISWLDRLKVRATYGINGNVYKRSGPYIISEVSPFGNTYTGEKQAFITSPPNKSLRWEKTNTTNFGLDYNLFSNRISGSIDIYNKNTTDLIGSIAADPTLGWDEVVRNYASMNNKGIEFQVYSKNIDNKDFKWRTSFLFSYNKSEITKLNTSDTSVSSYFGLQAREGKPFNSIYSIRYAGLDDTGSPTAYKADGSIVTSLGELVSEDLVHKGTYNPPYHMSFSNEIQYKQFELSFLFIYYGGHVQRDVAAGFYPTYSRPYTLNNNLDRIHLNYWKELGDEADIYTSPAYKATNDNTTDLWTYADIHVQKADYIKLRNIALAYSLPKSVLNQINISSLKLSFDVQNPLSWTANRNNLDPEVWDDQNGRGTAIMPTYTFGINLNF
ncbi:SusC/RagA family TonB-linked outer membrane protein [Flavivirga aquimarina]|uniref:SusC/RagA family TonB-linked outer membrane protein n=1 Tax=Flavivirga aquimarina TaxID=2027862 RepID=A0ABT8WCC7_9FLAO|nr:SusC/RagA family TonB-linked outer membrane protein [Flavivirga aquimarina]MDO5970773.1 SusC/RagA family TonB-linked outer membrane protein [Flavivirga aquimarina]